MVGKFRFLNYEDLINRCKEKRIIDIKRQIEYIVQDICLSDLITVLDFIGTKKTSDSLEIFKEIVSDSVIKYRKDKKNSLPLILTNVCEESFIGFDDIPPLISFFKDRKCNIPVINNYGEIISVLGLNKKSQAQLIPFLNKNNEKTINCNLLSSSKDKKLIESNRWLWIKKEDFYIKRFLISEIHNEMILHIIKNILKAIIPKHVQLQYGDHVLKLITPTTLYTDPKYTAFMARLLYSKFSKTPIDYIVSYSTQASILASTLRDEFRKENSDINELSIESYFNLYQQETYQLLKELKNKNILIVNDVVCNGRFLGKIADMIKQAGGKIQGLAAIVRTNDYQGLFEKKFYALCKYDRELYNAESCPACIGPKKEQLFVLNPRTNNLSPMSLRHEDLKEITKGKEENQYLWEMIQKENAVQTHVFVGEGHKHFYYYFDTHAILDKFKNEIQKLDMIKPLLYPDNSEPETILTTNNPSALKTANHLIMKYFPKAFSVAVEKKTGEYSIGDENKLMGKNILIFIDAVNTGTSINGLLNLCQRINGSLDNVRICIFLNRMSVDSQNKFLGSRLNNKNILTIYRIPIPSFTDDQVNCPLCIEVTQLKKYQRVMSLEARKYISERLEKIEAKEINHEDYIVSDPRENIKSNIFVRGKLLDSLYSKGRTAILEVLRLNVPLETLYLVLGLFPPEFIGMNYVKEWLSDQITKTSNIKQLTKVMRLALNVDPGVIWSNFEHIIKQFAKVNKNNFLSFVIEYLIHEKKIMKKEVHRRLNEVLKKSENYSSFITQLILSIIHGYPDKISQRPSLLEIYEKYILKTAPLDVSVLITGETGVGKEVVARMIHAISDRADKPFIEFSAATPEQFIESEFFGYEKGAFTGAEKSKKGRFEEADGGTAFFDEVGDIPLQLQVKLLRVFENKKFERLGSNETLESDFRLICATNKQVEKSVKDGLFREDLYFRINVVRIEIHPLRSYPEDITSLASYFLDDYCKKFNRSAIKYSKKLDRVLKSHTWPGNVRELKNIIEKAVAVYSEDGEIDIEGLKKEINMSEHVYSIPASESFKNKMEKNEKRILVEALDENNWHKTKTSECLGIKRQTLYNKMKKYQINREDLR